MQNEGSRILRSRLQDHFQMRQQLHPRLEPVFYNVHTKVHKTLAELQDLKIYVIQESNWKNRLK